MHSLQATVFVCIRKSPCQARVYYTRDRRTRKFWDAFGSRVIDAQILGRARTCVHDAQILGRVRNRMIDVRTMRSFISRESVDSSWDNEVINDSSQLFNISMDLSNFVKELAMIMLHRAQNTLITLLINVWNYILKPTASFYHIDTHIDVRARITCIDYTFSEYGTSIFWFLVTFPQYASLSLPP